MIITGGRCRRARAASTPATRPPRRPVPPITRASAPHGVSSWH